MDKEPRRPINKESLINLNLKVSNMMHTNGSWNDNVLQFLFPTDEILWIKAIYTDVNKKDFWLWPFTKSWAFSVQTSFVASKRDKYRDYVIDGALNGVKNRVWTIKTILKIKIFLYIFMACSL